MKGNLIVQFFKRNRISLANGWGEKIQKDKMVQFEK